MSHAISWLVRLVLDTDVLIAALRSRTGASSELLDRALAEQFTLLLSVPLFLEYESVAKLEEHKKVHGLNRKEVDEVLDALARVAEPVTIRFLWRPMLSDPDDDMVLETAVNGQADLLVTFNLDDFREASRRFRLEILRPGKALKLLRTEGGGRS